MSVNYLKNNYEEELIINFVDDFEDYEYDEYEDDEYEDEEYEDEYEK